MSTWLKKCIGFTAVVILTASATQWATCRFYVLPQVWPWYAKWVGTSQGQLIDPAPMGCSDTDSRTMTIMLSVFTTLISLSKSIE